MKLSKRRQVALHKRDMKLRKQKPRTFGRLKKSFKTKSGKVVQNFRPSGFDDAGRPIYSARNVIPVVTLEGNTVLLDARVAARKIGEGKLRVQELKR